LSNEEQQVLVSVDEKTVDFYGDQITAVLAEVEGKEVVYVPLKPICDYLGLEWGSQRLRLNRDEELSEAQGMFIMNTPSGKQRMICLPLELLPGWLFGIQPNRVKPELKQKVKLYRKECFRVLWQAFKEEVLPFAQEGFSREITPREPNPVLVQIREQAKALVKLAEQQIEIEAKALDAQEQAYYAHQRLNEFGKFANRTEVRLGDLERLVKPGATISGSQAASISQSVKTLADYLTTKLGPTDKKGRVHYQSIFDELYRRFGVAKYDLIRQEDYQLVLEFLDAWRTSAGGTPPPRQSSMNLDD